MAELSFEEAILRPVRVSHHVAPLSNTNFELDLCKLTDLSQAAVLCELVNDDAPGTMARRDDCRAFADTWGLKMISIEQLANFRMDLEESTSLTNGHR